MKNANCTNINKIFTIDIQTELYTALHIFNEILT